MTILLTILASLLVFGAVIAVHEFGHFAAAKLSGIQVNEFAIGMGPALWKKIAGGTQYTLRLLPVGGYVAMEGEGSPESNQAERARRFFLSGTRRQARQYLPYALRHSGSSG